MFFRSQIRLSVLAAAMVLAGFNGSVAAVELNDDYVAAQLKDYDSACFELLDCKSGKTFRYNAEQCKKRLAPMSTFKIFNSLAGLESGVLKDANHEMKWDGKKGFLDAWNHDQTLSTAIRDSVVWYFQRVAQGVGPERMTEYIRSAHYGNEDISGGITRFWLANTLKISADEQVAFIKRLCFNELPFCRRSVNIVKEITELKQTSEGDLHGKTGSDFENGKWVLGWFVGYVVHADNTYVFATNIQSPDGANGHKARAITEEILEHSGLL